MVKYLVLMVALGSLLGMTTAIVKPGEADDVPPPLAYSGYNTDHEVYYVMDFGTGDVTTVQRTGYDMRREPAGETVTPDEMILQSPYDESLRLQFINETGKQMMGGGGYYRLYRLTPDGTREFIADKVKPVRSPYIPLLSPDDWSPLIVLDWSPNGRFFYFAPEHDGGSYAVYQYDLQSGDAPKVLLQPYYPAAVSCDSQSEWCVLISSLETIVGEITSREITWYLLNLNTGDISTIAASSFDSSGRIWWQRHTPAFIYVVPGAGDLTEIRLYDYSTQTDSLMVELHVAPYVYDVIWSPDYRWLAVSTSAESGEIFVVNMQQPNPEPLLITENIDIDISSSSVRWVSLNKLFFSGWRSKSQTQSVEGNVYYVTTLPGGDTRTAAEITAHGEDEAWSPDGRWLALSGLNELYVVDVLGTSAVRQIQIGLLDDIMCLGWYTPDVYARSKAYLCNMYMGGIG